jgi:hypothetical protein
VLFARNAASHCQVKYLLIDKIMDKDKDFIFMGEIPKESSLGMFKSDTQSSRLPELKLSRGFIIFHGIT